MSVVRQLRDAGFEALWAGGCVRDALLGLTPSDYDVATSATPQQVIDLFGRRWTVPVGVSFGVVMVLNQQHKCEPVEVATFRADGEYHDGRRPASVMFCSAREDAQRRDFTINGMFFDPIREEVIDYVGGQQDLQQRLVRAIGSATARFAEDKLRMLRAVRFSATFGFALDASTFDAISVLRSQIRQVSVERIAQELRRMFSHSSRHRSLHQLRKTGLLESIFELSQFRFVRNSMDDNETLLERIFRELQQPVFEPALSVLLEEFHGGSPLPDTRQIHSIRESCRQLKLSNDETETICWLIENSKICNQPTVLPLHILKPLMADARHELLIDVVQAAERAEQKPAANADFLRNILRRYSPEQLNPAPLVDGGDLKLLGLSPGPEFSRLLRLIRQEQLDEKLHSKEAAMSRLQEICSLPSQ